MNLKKLSVAVLLGVGLVGSAMATDTVSGLKEQAMQQQLQSELQALAPKSDLAVSGDVHAASSYQYRGQQFSDGEPSIGASITARHSSGLYGTLESDTVKLGTTSNSHQLQNALTVGYDFHLPDDVIVGGGVKRSFFTGQDHVSDLSFSEAFVGASWKGLHAKVSTVVENAKAQLPGFNTGDTYGEIGYTYQYRQFSLGGDVGYSLYNRADNAKNGLSLAQVRVGYDFNNHVGVNLAYQFAGNDAMGRTATGTHKAIATVDYKF